MSSTTTFNQSYKIYNDFDIKQTAWISCVIVMRIL